MEYYKTEFDNSFAHWQRGDAFHPEREYALVNRSSFYANIRGEYRGYMLRWVKNALDWYDGFVEHFHDAGQGILSTHIGQAIVNGAARKVVGGRLFFKNKNRETPKKGENGAYVVNDALAYIASAWASKVSFAREVKKAVTFAAAGGTALIKLDKRGGVLYPKALRFDSFYPTVGFDGETLVDLVCFIRDFTKLGTEKQKGCFESYYVVEHRYFGQYVYADGGKSKRDVPLVEYKILRSSGTTAGNGERDYNYTGQSVQMRELPRTVRSDIARAFSGIIFDKPMLLPFPDSLGAELVNWTDCISAIPELPFGESLLTNIIPFLKSYDYYFSAFNTDMYIGRGRVIIPKFMQSGSAREKSGYNSGLDGMLFTQVESPSVSDTNPSPTPVQFDLRAQSWTEIRTMLLQNIAVNTGMNLATIASFLNDGAGQRTAREISTEESETALFVEDKREIIEKPLNRILKLVTMHEGFTDDVVIRWAEAGLSNMYMRTEMLVQAVSNHLVSRQKAAQMFSQDDDEYQQAEEWQRIKEDLDDGGGEDWDLGNADTALGEEGTGEADAQPDQEGEGTDQ